MSDKINYRFFKFRSEAQRSKHAGYRVGLIASALYAFFSFNKKYNFDLFLSAVKKIFSTPILSGIEVKKADVSFFCSIARDDYFEIIDFVRSELIVAGVDLDRTEMILLDSRFSTVKEILLSVKPAFRLAKAHSGNLTQRLFYFACYIYLLKGFNLLEKTLVELPSAAVFFNSSSFPESMLCEFFRARGVKTFSLQHGMYLRPNVLSYDIVNISNVMAETLLCWGHASKEEVESFYKENEIEMEFKCAVAGYPRSTSNKASSKVHSNKILVLLPRALYRNECLELIRELQEFKDVKPGEEFIVKPHPSLVGDRELELQCNKLCGGMDLRSLTDCLGVNAYKAVIGFNTTAIFEAIPNSSRIFLFYSGKDEFTLDCFRSFSSSGQLSFILNSELDEGPAYEYFFGDNSRQYANIIVG